MNNLSREKQIEVIAALCEGVGIRTASRLTGVNRGTVGRRQAQYGQYHGLPARLARSRDRAA